MSALNQDYPKAYRFWPKYAQDLYDERVAILREGDDIASTEQTPIGIKQIASEEAMREIALVAAQTK